MMFLAGMGSLAAYIAIGVMVVMVDWLDDFNNPRLWPGLIWPIYIPLRLLGLGKREWKHG